VGRGRGDEGVADDPRPAAGVLIGVPASHAQIEVCFDCRRGSAPVRGREATATDAAGNFSPRGRGKTARFSSLTPGQRQWLLYSALAPRRGRSGTPRPAAGDLVCLPARLCARSYARVEGRHEGKKGSGLERGRRSSDGATATNAAGKKP
jgi:hypothetical protein